MTKAGLKTEIEDIVQILKAAGKNRLAKCIEENWDKTAIAYSKELNSYEPKRPMEKELISAFEKELERLETPSDLKIKILDSLERRRVLQTAPHLVATQGPRMFCINWLGSLGVEKEDFYVIGMFSGIPFSNSFRPGRINKKETINLIPSRMQNDPVFQSRIPEKLVETVKTLPEKLQKILPEAKVGESFTQWALQSCGNIERQILGKENMVYLDINKVVANYLEEIENNSSHPMNKLKGRENIFVVFSALLLNHFKCFGSFRQVEYLPKYQLELCGLEFLKDYGIEKIPTMNLTTGEFANKLYPADIILGERFAPDSETLFGELILNMRKTFLYD